MQRYLWLVVLIGGLAAAWTIGEGGSVSLGALVAVSAVLLAWWMSPFTGGRTRRHSDVMNMPADERRVVIYWRPGCIFCQRLKGGLGKDADKALWINIWQDAEAAEFVRSVNGGNETVPTVVIDGEAFTNPDPREVREAFA